MSLSISMTTDKTLPEDAQKTTVKDALRLGFVICSFCADD